MSRAMVYIRIQDDLPRCFWTSLKKTRELWTGPIYLVAPQRELNYPMLEEYNVTKIPVESIKDDLLDQYTNGTFFDYPGWNGFWDLTCKRHIYYYLVMKQHGISEAIHLETDVVPYLSLNYMFDVFAEVFPNKLAFTTYTEYQLSSHFLYCNNPDILEKFSKGMVEYFGRGEQHFKNKYKGQVILAENHFAYAFWEENRDLCDLIPTMPDEPHYDKLEFLIDPQGYGMWLSGVRENPGVQYAANTHHIGKRLLADQYDVLFSYRIQDRTIAKSLPHLYDAETSMTHPIGAIHFNSKVPEPWI